MYDGIKFRKAYAKYILSIQFFFHKLFNGEFINSETLSWKLVDISRESLKKDQNDHFIYKDYSDHSYIIVDFNNQKR